MGAPSTSSMGTHITGTGSSGGVQSLSGSMSAPMSAPLTQVGMNDATSSILTQSTGAVLTRRPMPSTLGTHDVGRQAGGDAF
jgi:hypothetical protein